jgi:hypothetical protein
LIATKVDLPKERRNVSQEQAQHLAKQHGMECLECSNDNEESIKAILPKIAESLAKNADKPFDLRNLVGKSHLRVF